MQTRLLNRDLLCFHGNINCLWKSVGRFGTITSLVFFLHKATGKCWKLYCVEARGQTLISQGFRYIINKSEACGKRNENFTWCNWQRSLFQVPTTMRNMSFFSTAVKLDSCTILFHCYNCQSFLYWKQNHGFYPILSRFFLPEVTPSPCAPAAAAPPHLWDFTHQ